MSSRLRHSRPVNATALVVPLLFLCAVAPPDDEYAAARARMVQQQIAEGDSWGREAVTNASVLRAMRAVPRHQFVPPGQVSQAYDDRPLPIGYGQTISQPYIVGKMTELLKVDANSVVLEVGTGSGYQAAILAELVKDVFTIEIISPLAEQASKRLKALGYSRAHARAGDGYFGWADHAPYDGIIVTAAASHIPPPLVEQLKAGGRLIIPVGPPFGLQQLLVLEKRKDGSITQRSVMSVKFVPLTGRKEGQESASPRAAK
ncbi:MAG: protein-L-isoaspartate(D-aspartate) O-methyltransferase [Candidatus Hydrogenedentes bacterium]|nr:protein-L-isoaspartate(D-aspartate) O-methyltransferase [Candidatus Hydrogenedentota bacterium]